MTRIKNEDGWLCLGNLIFVPSVVSIGKYKTEAPDIKPQKVAIAMPMLRMRMKIVSRSNKDGYIRKRVSNCGQHCRLIICELGRQSLGR